MNNNIDIEKVKETYIKAINMSTKPNFERPNIGDIIDENQTVVWNRNEVDNIRHKWENKRNELIEAKHRLITNCENDIVKYIADSCNMSESKAKLMFDFAYANKHEYIEDMFSYIEELIDLFINIREA